VLANENWLEKIITGKPQPVFDQGTAHYTIARRVGDD
jgi:hypothetical protein